MEAARDHVDNTRTQDSDDDEEDSSDADPEDEEIVEESESNEEDDASGASDERRSESGDQPGQTASPKDKSPELAAQVEGLQLTSPAADPGPEPEGDLAADSRSTEETLPSLPTGKEVLRHLVSNELTRQQAKQKVKYHSKKSGAGRTRGSKAKQDTRVKLSDHW